MINPKLVLDAKVLVAAAHSRNDASFETAIAEKVGALKTESYFRERWQRGEEAGLDAWLEASPDVPPLAGDEHRR